MSLLRILLLMVVALAGCDCDHPFTAERMRRARASYHAEKARQAPPIQQPEKRSSRMFVPVIGMSYRTQEGMFACRSLQYVMIVDGHFLRGDFGFIDRAARSSPDVIVFTGNEIVTVVERSHNTRYVRVTIGHHSLWTIPEALVSI